MILECTPCGARLEVTTEYCQHSSEARRMHPLTAFTAKLGVQCSVEAVARSRNAKVSGQCSVHVTTGHAYIGKSM